MLLPWPSCLKHPQDPVNGDRGEQMLERMTADDVAERVNPLIEHLGDLRQHVKAGRNKHVRSAVIARGKKYGNQHDGGHRVKLYCDIAPEVADAVKLRPVPVEHAARAQRDERRQQPQAGPYAYTLADNCGKQGRESHRQR